VPPAQCIILAEAGKQVIRAAVISAKKATANTLFLIFFSLFRFIIYFSPLFL
jgi:hypothetical protein